MLGAKDRYRWIEPNGMKRLRFHACLNSRDKTFRAMGRTSKMAVRLEALRYHIQGPKRNDQKPVLNPGLAQDFDFCTTCLHFHRPWVDRSRRNEDENCLGRGT